MFKQRVNQAEQYTDIEADVSISEGATKMYEKPVLIAYCDVRDITLGPTVGEGESGAALFFRVPSP